ncbi:hypothetical protein ACFYO1_21440 [Nocardia sp. NPDC006044]|uniref:hypothetical protein n=1 Tax=Nocardia sp. NPDC006044 TaxID=3364306 RepID=UPI00369B69A7
MNIVTKADERGPAMAISATDWLITSDVAHEAAFRVDLPEQDRGKWILSYLPTHRRLTRNQAMAGMVLAEMIVLGGLYPAGLNHEVAQLHAAELGSTLPDIMSLLALRAPADSPEPDVDWCPADDRTRSAAALLHGTRCFAA